MIISTFFSTKKIVLIRKSTFKLLCTALLLTALFWLFNFYKTTAATYVRMEGLREIRVFSTEFPYFSYSVDDSAFSVLTEKKLLYKTTSPLTGMSDYDQYSFAFLYDEEEQIVFYYSPTLNKVYNKEHLLEPSHDLKEVLLDLAALYEQEVKIKYGALLVWEEVDKVFPMFAVAKITDIYTGATFYVQRREGCSHVDAQPLTAEDTAIMKQIFDGRWTWDRKGIVVEVGGHRIAASMNGMPHGAGKIDDNNFPGHFCIHFLGSSIHSGNMDIRHHREILKAAGKLPLGDSDSLPNTTNLNEEDCIH